MICQKRHNDTKFENSQYFSWNALKLSICLINMHLKTFHCDWKSKNILKSVKNTQNGQFSDMSQWHEIWKESIFQQKYIQALNAFHVSRSKKGYIHTGSQ